MASLPIAIVFISITGAAKIQAFSLLISIAGAMRVHPVQASKLFINIAGTVRVQASKFLISIAGAVKERASSS